jgi:hypothetical protein
MEVIGNMSKKITSFVMLFIFICFTFSCTSIKQINLVKGESLNKRTGILTVFTKSGDLIEFSDERPAKIEQGKISGTVIDKTEGARIVSIPLSDAEVVWVRSESAQPLLLVPLAVFGILASVGFIYMLANPI